MHLQKFTLVIISSILWYSTHAQQTNSINGVADVRSGSIAFINATIIKDASTTLTDGTLLIKNGRIISVDKSKTIPTDAVIIDCTGKYIYPSFIDLYSDYGLPTPARATRGNDFAGGVQLGSNTKGAYGSNQAIKPETNAAATFANDEAKAKTLRDIGFGIVLTHNKDGVARGTGSLVDLSAKKENFTMLKEKAAAFYSFSKGTSTQSYPSSMMGSIALLRQTFLDAKWYKANVRPSSEGTNLSLQAWNSMEGLPHIFEANDKWNDLRADRIGDEYGVQFILKAGQNEYERIAEIKATNASFIVPLNFPTAIDVDDPNDVRFVSLATLKQWEMAPSNPAAFEKANINFCLTMADVKDAKQFLPNLRKAIQYGLSPTAALNALTKNPAQLIGMYNEIGSLDVGKLANFLITDGNLFADKTTLIQNWIQGEKNSIKEDNATNTNGKYALQITNENEIKNIELLVQDNNTANIINKDTLPAKYSSDGKNIKLYFTETKSAKKGYRLSGINTGKLWSGTGTDSTGKAVLFTASFISPTPPKKDIATADKVITMGKLTYPNMAYGYEQAPTQQNILIKNTTVWTNEQEGILNNTDVWIQNGKITAVGKNINAPLAKIIDGTNKHLTAGIIDEHSHIATASVNESGQSVTSEVRIGDNLDPDDIDIYRQLSGGVTTSHILHGSSNTIGGQTQLIKLRWGANDTALKFAGADGFIKFALGENVKRNYAQQNNRYPDTRMGVEQVQVDAFTRAQDYAKALKGVDAKKVRKDLELDALVEIMEAKRFVTCHSYVASEIVQTMEMATKFGFKINTFTHILEGYKVADKMKAHGAAASSFSDWWAYKIEVQDAIPYNPSIMHNVGINVAINSDDAEMARRLNQEAAKSIKYGGLSEIEALKLITLNPAKMLHIDNKVGSIKNGKDADVVLWSSNPLSIYTKAEITIVDGIIYFDREKDILLRKQIFDERNRIIQKLIAEKNGGSSTTPAKASLKRMNTCGDHVHGLLADEDEL